MSFLFKVMKGVVHALGEKSEYRRSAIQDQITAAQMAALNSAAELRRALLEDKHKRGWFRTAVV